MYTASDRPARRLVTLVVIHQGHPPPPPPVPPVNKNRDDGGGRAQILGKRAAQVDARTGPVPDRRVPLNETPPPITGHMRIQGVRRGCIMCMFLSETRLSHDLFLMFGGEFFCLVANQQTSYKKIKMRFSLLSRICCIILNNYE